jgi:hypothetical protein
MVFMETLAWLLTVTMVVLLAELLTGNGSNWLAVTVAENPLIVPSTDGAFTVIVRTVVLLLTPMKFAEVEQVIGGVAGGVGQLHPDPAKPA